MTAVRPARAAAFSPGAPLSIAYLTYRGKPHVGGQGVYTRHLTKALVDLGHTVEVFGGQPLLDIIRGDPDWEVAKKYGKAHSVGSYTPLVGFAALQGGDLPSR